jgi:hypothetical protein
VVGDDNVEGVLEPLTIRGVHISRIDADGPL